MPSRHSKNATSNTIYTHHERKKDAKSSGYGTQTVRLAKEAVAEWDYCSLSLQPCRDPVVTPNGYLFDREAILRYMLEKKHEVAKRLKEYERAKKAEQNELAELERARKEDLARKAMVANAPTASIALTLSNSVGSSQSEERRTGGSREWYADGRAKSFWVPELAPDCSKPRGSDASSTTSKLSITDSYTKLTGAPSTSTGSSSRLEKPSEKVLCPFSSAPLSIRDLITVRFTPASSESASKAPSGIRQQYVCAATGDLLTNATRCCVLRPSGRVVTKEYVDRIIKCGAPDSWRDPVTGDRLTDSDIIELRRGGTGFAAVNSTELSASRKGIVLNC